MKIFGIGFHKTGTSSLAEALSRLGFSVTGPNGKEDPNISQNALDLIKDLVPRYDAFQDNPWPVMYREVDRLYPGSKFILTVRPPEDWIRSVMRHFSGSTTPMREWIYGFGDPEGHESAYLDTYNRHNREVLEYFTNRPEDLLVMRITEGEGWEVLCPFLRLPTRATADFPHQNSARARGSHARRLAGRLMSRRQLRG